MQNPKRTDRATPQAPPVTVFDPAAPAPRAPAAAVRKQSRRRPAARGPQRPRRRGTLFVWLLAPLVGVAGVVLLESHTSVLQAQFFARWSAQLRYRVAAGASTAIAFPVTGPFDERRGYTRMPQFTERLQHSGYRISAQARQTPELVDVIRRHIAPPFPEPPLADLTIRDTHGALLHGTSQAQLPVWRSLDEVPPLVVNSLLFIENRSIGIDSGPMQNPAVDLGRSAKALALYMGRSIGMSWPLEGGSTLATQLEKFRHSPAGHTSSPQEKLRQIVSASLAAYHEGMSTRRPREQIILDYLNTMPLGAAPGIGEVNGLSQGLAAWFGSSARDVFAALRAPEDSPEKARAYRQVLALLYSVHAPSYYLHDHAALDSRLDAYLGLLSGAGVLDAGLAGQLRGMPLTFAGAMPPPAGFVDRKAANAVRAELSGLLGVGNLYDLDRLSLTADTTIDAELQARVGRVLKQLADPSFVATAGLREPHLLEHGDPGGITWSMLLLEARPEGNVVRVRTDTHNGPLDVNEGTKLELGSTAKLRTLVHYLEIVSQLRAELSALQPEDLATTAVAARDPLTRWAAYTLFATPGLTDEELLERALDRSYPGSPAEAFFTGGGIHHFRNFEPDDDLHELSVRTALVRSNNLVFIRLMRDVVQFHEARLPYDAHAVLADLRSPERRALLEQIAAAEEKRTHASARWLLAHRNRLIADTRLRIRIERDAFERMTPGWRRLGFPFEHLVPSYATALGSSADRPTALAELMGILVNDGRRLPTYDIERLSFAAGTPYETVMTHARAAGERVISEPIARTVRRVLGEVVDRGTARRLKGVFHGAANQPLPVGGKTGSGDNRYETFARDGTLLTARPVSRTGVFVFYLGERWYGVITASVAGDKAGDYSFTSSLPLAALKLLAPTLSAAIRHEPLREAPQLAVRQEPRRDGPAPAPLPRPPHGGTRIARLQQPPPPPPQLAAGAPHPAP
jgi:membrane peptidoglycan carboxypeptidase